MQQPTLILVHTDQHTSGGFRWFIGFLLDGFEYKAARNVIVFDDGAPRRHSIEHFDQRRSAHCYFLLSELSRAQQHVDDQVANKHWNAEREQASFAECLETIRSWKISDA